MLLGDMIMLVGACVWMLMMTVADPAMGLGIWSGILVYLGFLVYRLGHRRSRYLRGDRIRKVRISGDRICVYGAYSSTALPLRLPATMLVFFAFLFVSIKLGSREGIAVWSLLLLFVGWLIARRDWEPPRSGPPPASPPPNLSPAGTPVLPVFPDDVLMGADEKEIPVQRTG